MCKAKVKYRDHAEIREEVERFRSLEGVRKYNELPIDVIIVAELVLQLDPIPILGLFEENKIDAALSPDLSNYYVDEDSYKAWDKGPIWKVKRLRFSIAHEIGHYVLHGPEIRQCKFHSIPDFKSWAGDPNNYQSAEYQADEFAGRFLVPIDDLLKEYDYYCEKEKRANPKWRSVEGMRASIAERIAPRFSVSRQVIEVRFDREGIWRAE